MKKLKTFINRLFSQSSDTINQYLIVYSNPLSSSQVATITNKMINKFYPNCSPNSVGVSASTATVRLQFTSPCIDGEALKNIGEKTIEGVGQANPVKLISLNGSQIWPSQEHSTATNQKTAMHQLIDEIVEHLTYDDDLTVESRNTLEAIRLRCLNKLTKEKDQIINTFKDAQALHAMDNQTRGEQYYNETYGK